MYWSLASIEATLGPMLVGSFFPNSWQAECIVCRRDWLWNMKPRCCSCYSELPDCVKVFGCGLIWHFCWPVRSKQPKKRHIAKPSDGPNNYCSLLTAESYVSFILFLFLILFKPLDELHTASAYFFYKGFNKDCLWFGILDLSPLVYYYISSTVENDLFLYGGRRNLILFSRI